MPAFIQQARLDKGESDLLAAVLSGAAIEEVLKEIRRLLKNHQVALAAAAKSSTLTAAEATSVVSELDARAELLRSLPGAKAAALLDAHTRALKLLAQVQDELNN